MPTDISQLPAPTVITTMTHADIFAAMLADLVARDPSISLSPSDPAYKILEVAAYREMILREDFNDRARNLMLAFSTGSTLDHLGVTYYRTARLVIEAGDPNAIPPIAPAYESDADYRQRLLLAEDQYSTAGAEGAYVFHVKSADGSIKDVKISSPSPGQVVITVLAKSGDGTPSQAILDSVTSVLNDGVRPLTDQVMVQAPAVVNYTVNATLTVYPGVNQSYVRQVAEQALTAWIASQHLIGRDIAVNGIEAALCVPGVHDITLNSTVGTDIVTNLVISDTEVAYCTGVTVVVGGIGG